MLFHGAKIQNISDLAKNSYRSGNKDSISLPIPPIKLIRNQHSSQG